MSPVQYDAFGEVMAGLSGDRLKAKIASPGAVRRFGVALFWIIAAFVVTARVFFFQPDIYASFHDHPAAGVVDGTR